MEIRKSQPKNNKYYIRQVSGGLNGAVAGSPTISGANVLANCVGYANGRFNEIINDPDLKGVVKAFKYQLVCNAENFIESAKKQGLKISDVPIQGGILVWQKGATLGGGDGAGHVAIVEEIYEDGSIFTSESGWGSRDWAFKNLVRTNDNGRWGQSSAYKFRGCIINPGVKDPKIAPVPPLVVDGIGGANTVRAMQKYFGTPQDGVISGQNKALKKCYPSLTAVEYSNGGSVCIKKLQKWVGTTQDGVLGEKTIKAWQKKLGVSADGIFGANSMKAWQTYLNKELHGDTTPVDPPKPIEPQGSYKVIDVSDWQGQIDWAKVKADGVVGAIIRYADGIDTLDKRFAENMKNAKAAGLHIGSYLFSRAKTKAEAEKEAEVLFNACKPYAPDMPLYIDLEVATLKSYANTVAQAFLNKMVKLGGRGGVYANLNWWNNYLVDTAKNYSANPFWIAQYNDTMDYKPASKMGMWQYTSSGRVNGISGNVDMNHCYRAYWEDAPQPPKPSKTIEELAYEVLDGKWGSGDARKKNLEAAGYDYDAVQKKVNEILEYRELIQRLADEVLQGKWGNSDERKRRLTEAGYDYDAVQSRVNLIVSVLDACKAQAEWSKNSKYAWESDPTIEKSKLKETCVTFVGCVLQRVGILPSGKYIWHDESGKVYGNNDKMIVSYPKNKTLSQLKDELKAGDIVMDGDKNDSGSGSHIFVLTGKWQGDKPIIWDNHSAQQGYGAYVYGRDRNVIDIVRLK